MHELKGISLTKGTFVPSQSISDSAGQSENCKVSNKYPSMPVPGANDYTMTTAFSE